MQQLAEVGGEGISKFHCNRLMVRWRGQISHFVKVAAAMLRFRRASLQAGIDLWCERASTLIRNEGRLLMALDHHDGVKRKLILMEWRVVVRYEKMVRRAYYSTTIRSYMRRLRMYARALAMLANSSAKAHYHREGVMLQAVFDAWCERSERKRRKKRLLIAALSLAWNHLLYPLFLGWQQANPTPH